jgi:outer membrane lipoprotein SlyB
MTHPSESPRRLHPLVATAAATIIIASLAATAAITGLFPRASSTGAQSDQTQSAQVANQPVVDSAAPAAAQAIAPQQQAAATGQTTQSGRPDQSAQVQQAPVQMSPAPAAPPAGQPQYAGQPAQAPYAQQQQQPGQQRYAAPQPQPQAAACASCGTVESIVAVRRPGHGTGIGAVGGAVAGGLVGNQFGAGTGRTAMTILGAVGGGFAGNSVEKRLRSQTDYQVRVRMENGRMRYFTYRQPPPFQQGESVRIVHGALVAR